MNQSFNWRDYMANGRINEIYEAATKLFLQQGYSKTQISHIAKAIGVSVGTIYHDFTGKEEIMHFILKCTIDPDFINKEFDRPITDELFVGLEQEIISVFEMSAEQFAMNLETVGNVYDFKKFVSDAFDTLSRYAVGCLFIEKNYMDCPVLAKHYNKYRKNFFNTMKEYMTGFMEKGMVRQIKNIELTTTLIIEILTWWAMDMRYTSFETSDVPVEQAKEVCLDNIVSAYSV